MKHRCAKFLGVVTFLLCVSGAIGCSPAASADTADTFDAPLKTKVIDLGASDLNLPGRRNLRLKLYCWFYPTFLLKQYDDESKKGTQWIAIVPVQGGVIPPCNRAHARGEILIQDQDWGGFFQGAKGNLLFVDAPDGEDGGMPFFICDFRTGKRIFEDSSYDSRMWSRPVHLLFDRMRVHAAPNNDVILTYLRVVEADCDLHSEGTTCWENTKKKLGLKGRHAPVCTGYKGISSRWVSAVAYPVEVSLFPQPSRTTIAGPVKCWPVD